MPGRQGAWNLKDILAWKQARLRDPGNDSQQSSTEVLTRKRLAEAELAEEKARAKKRENEVAAGNLVDIREVISDVSTGFALIKNYLEGIPEVLTREVGPEHKAIVAELSEDIIHRALLALADCQIGERGESINDLILSEAETITQQREYDAPRIHNGKRVSPTGQTNCSGDAGGIDSEDSPSSPPAGTAH